MKYNTGAFVELIKRYEAMTIERITETGYEAPESDDKLGYFTAFDALMQCTQDNIGGVWRCILCEEAGALSQDRTCKCCLYYKVHAKSSPCLNSQYFAMRGSNSPEMLYSYIQERIVAMKEILKKYG